jgi:hypothetical protein
MFSCNFNSPGLTSDWCKVLSQTWLFGFNDYGVFRHCIEHRIPNPGVFIKGQHRRTIFCHAEMIGRFNSHLPLFWFVSPWTRPAVLVFIGGAKFRAHENYSDT